MSLAVRARLVEHDSGRSVPLSDDGLSVGGPDTDLEVVEAEGIMAYLDPVAAGVVVTDAGRHVVTVNAAPVIGQRLAYLGDTVRFATVAFVLEADAERPSIERGPGEPTGTGVAETVEGEERSPEAIGISGEPPPSLDDAGTALEVGPAPSLVPIAQLEVLGGGMSRGQIFDLVARLSLIGRGAHNDVVLDDDTVSDSHARIIRRATGWFVLDEGSSNGTYVAGRRIDGEHGLAPGSEVRFGGVKLRFAPCDADMGAREGKGTRQVIARPQAKTGGVASGRAEAMAPAAPVVPAEPAAVSAPPGVGTTQWRTVLGWLLVLAVVAGSGAAGYLIAAMLRGGR